MLLWWSCTTLPQSNFKRRHQTLAFTNHTRSTCKFVCTITLLGVPFVGSRGWTSDLYLDQQVEQRLATTYFKSTIQRTEGNSFLAKRLDLLSEAPETSAPLFPFHRSLHSYLLPRSQAWRDQMERTMLLQLWDTLPTREWNKCPGCVCVTAVSLMFVKPDCDLSKMKLSWPWWHTVTLEQSAMTMSDVVNVGASDMRLSSQTQEGK